MKYYSIVIKGHEVLIQATHRGILITFSEWNQAKKKKKKEYKL